MRQTLLALLMMTTAASAEAPRVMTDIAPVRAIAAAVMDGIAQPEMLLEPGQSPHDYAMRPSQARAIAQADLVIWIGPGLTGWLEGPLESLSTTAQLALLDVPQTQLLRFREAEAFGAAEHAEHADHAVGHQGHSGHDHEDAHAGGADPHAWLDPQNAALWAGAIAVRLAEIDPENAQTYRRNADILAAQIEATAQEIDDKLTAVRGTRFLVLHDAYHYFEHRFEIEAYETVHDGHAATPGPRQVARLRQMVQEDGIACVFTEPQMNTDLVDTIAEDATLRIGVLDPLEGASYPALLRRMADAMVACLSPA